VKAKLTNEKQNKAATMKTKVTETTSTLGIAGWLFSRIACLGAVILICSSAFAQNLCVSGTDARGGEIFKFTWDAKQSIFASELADPRDLAFDSAGNLFVADYEIVDYDPGAPLLGNSAVYKITPSGAQTIFASGLSHHSYLAVDKAGNLFVADYDQGIIYKYKPNRTRATFASGLHHPVGMAFDSTGNLFVADNSVGNIYQGSIYQYHPDGSRVTFAVLDQSDRPADLAFDSTGNLLMADLGGNIYKYQVGVLRRYARTTFGSVPNGAQSLACDSAGNLFVVDAGDVNGSGNGIYKFTAQGVRSIFAPGPVPSGQASGETFSHVAFQPLVCCQTATLTATPAPRLSPTPKASSNAVPSAMMDGTLIHGDR
jgi:sugar lactone lactonase YvrE